jgi:hypothetical protein
MIVCVVHFDVVCLEEVSLTYLVRKVDVQPNYSGSSFQICEFRFLLFKNNTLGASPTVFLSVVCLGYLGFLSSGKLNYEFCVF